MEMLKRKLKGLALCVVVVVTIVAIRWAYEKIDSRRVINWDTLERDITTIVHHFSDAPNLEEKVRPWDSELPALVSKDIKYMEKEPSLNWIEYKFYEWRFYIYTNSEGDPYIGINCPTTPYLCNFSIYSIVNNGKDALVLYGYYRNNLMCYTFCKDYFDSVSVYQ